MRYTLQLNTGTYAAAAIDAKSAAETLDKWLGALPVSRVIYGWARGDELNGAILSSARRHGAEAYLWLPVFAETTGRTDPFIPADGKTGSRIDAVKGEGFEFVCPSSRRNVQSALESLSALTRAARPDGVFLDRIRYPSMVIPGAVWGCLCPECLRRYREAGVDTDRVKRLAAEGGHALFVPAAREGARLRFGDGDIDRLFKAKRDIVTGSVALLAAELRRLGYRLGLDLFAPSLADTVGQDAEVLTSLADMVKPMLYYSTTAPAGLPFEAAALPAPVRERLAELWGAPVDDEAGMAAQLSAFGKRRDRVSAGLEVNRVEGVCSATPADFSRRLALLREAGCTDVTLCWNIFAAGDDMLKAAEGLS